MRIIFKIIAAPFVAILTVIGAVFTFLFCVAASILGYISGIGALLAIVMFIGGQTPGGIAFLVGAFLISPFGIPAIAEWLIVKMHGLNYALRDFITS